MAERRELSRQIPQLNRRRSPQRRIIRRDQGNQQAAAHVDLFTGESCTRARDASGKDQKKLVILVRIAFTTTEEGE